MAFRLEFLMLRIPSATAEAIKEALKFDRGECAFFL
jgi:hypothetical protein